MKRWIIFVAALAWAASAGAQKAYRWVDADGRVTYSDRPPPPTASRAETRNLRGSVIETSDPPYAVRQAAKDFPVTLYVADKCDACAAARRLLENRGVPFSEVAVGDAASIEELKRLSGASYVPLLKVGSSIVKGYEPGQYNAALDLAGYPQSVPGHATAGKSESSRASGSGGAAAR